MELYETLPIVPLRDVVVFPHMMMPFVIGRPSSTRALEHALGKDKRIFLAAQHDAADRRAAAQRHLHDGLRRQHRPEPEAARRQHQGAGRGHRARPRRRVEGRQGLLPRRRQSRAEAEGSRRRRGSDDDQGGVAVRAVREAVEQPALRRHDCRRPRGRSRQAGRHHLGAPRRRRGREAEPARDHLPDRTAQPDHRPARGGGRQAPGGSQDPVARQEADGEGAEGVLPQREDEGDPEGTGPQGREGQRDRGAEEEDRTVEDARGGRGEGHPGAEAAGVDAADVGGSDRLAQLSRLADRRPVAEEDQGEPGSRSAPRRSSTRTTTGWRRSRTASSSSSPSAPWSRSRRRRSSRSRALPASARRRWRSRSRAR